jgi:hypothetical protein
MKISYPAGSIECIVAGGPKGNFAIWCYRVTYEFSELDKSKSAHPSTVLCKALGVGPAPSQFAIPIRGTIYYDLDGMAPSGTDRANFLTFKATTKGVDVEIVFEVSAEMFRRTFDNDEHRALCPPEELGVSGRNPNYDPGSRD